MWGLHLKLSTEWKNLCICLLARVHLFVGKSVFVWANTFHWWWSCRSVRDSNCEKLPTLAFPFSSGNWENTQLRIDNWENTQEFIVENTPKLVHAQNLSCCQEKRKGSQWTFSEINGLPKTGGRIYLKNVKRREWTRWWGWTRWTRWWGWRCKVLVFGSRVIPAPFVPVGKRANA